MSVLNQSIRIHYIQIAFIFWCQLSINNSKPLEGGWRKRYHDLYSMLLNRPRWWGTGIVSIPKHWSYKEDNPLSTPLSQRSRSFSFRNLKPLIITRGRVVSQLIQVRNKWHQRGPYKTNKDSDGSEYSIKKGSHSFLLLLRVCMTSFFLILLSLNFAWTVSFVITVSGMPQFCKSPS